MRPHFAWALFASVTILSGIPHPNSRSFKNLPESASTNPPALENSSGTEGPKILIEDILLGKGDAVARGDKVSVWYSSRLMDTDIIYDEANASRSEPVSTCQ